MLDTTKYNKNLVCEDLVYFSGNSSFECNL